MKKKLVLFVVSLLTYFFSGCASQQKTIVLPEVEHADTEETENSDMDFTVKKIYTYDYETVWGLDKSAFLKDSGTNEIRILMTNESEGSSILDLRSVDYRYGFYDVTGQMKPEQIDDWDVLELLPSPDGKKILVYNYSMNRNALYICLYDLESQTQDALFYEEFYDWRWMEIRDNIQGSWSESGRWVTYDVLGILGRTVWETNVIPVFDTGKESIRSDASKSGIEIRQPDREMISMSEDYWLLMASLLDGAEGEAWMIGISWEESSSVLHPIIETWTQVSNSDPGKGMEYEVQFQTCDLYWNETVPYLGYFVDIENDLIYSHMENDRQIISTNYKDQRIKGFYEIPANPLLFHRLENNNFLVAQYEKWNFNDEIVGEMDGNDLLKTSGLWSPLQFQLELDIKTLDLYLYSEREPRLGEEYSVIEGGQLIYKDVEHLIAMEYDPDTRRILLETVPDYDRPQYRQCIILEM